MHILKKYIRGAVYTLYRTLMPWKSRHRAIILAYHSVAHSEHDPFSINPEEFIWQVEELRRQGFTIVRMQRLEEMLKAGDIQPKTAVLTFDDGRRDNYSDLFPVLKHLSIPVTIFLVTDAIGKELAAGAGTVSILTSSEISEMHASGLVDFEPHTASHTILPTIPADAVRLEITRSKELIERMLSKSCRYFAYPHGKYSADIQHIASQCGIEIACATHNGPVTLQSPRMAIPRNGIDRNTTRMDFRGIIAHGRIR